MQKLIVVLLFVLTVSLASFVQLAHGAQDSNNLWMEVNTKGNFDIDWLSVDYTLDPNVKAYFSLNFNTSTETAPYISVKIWYDKTQYSHDNPVFSQAQLTIWGTTFNKNGTLEAMTFSGDEVFDFNFNYSIDYYPNGPSSGQNVIIYTFNLSQCLIDAQDLFAESTNQTGLTQSNMRCIIGFDVSPITQGISYNGQQRQLQFDCVIESFIVKNYMFKLTLPENYVLVNDPTLNAQKMYVTPNTVMGSSQNNYGYDSNGNKFWPNSVVVNWQVPTTPPIWEVQPYDWIISAVIGVVISTGLVAMWNKVRKPNLQISLIKHPRIYGQQQIAFYLVKIRNKGKTTAHDCSIRITFIARNRQLFTISGKWDSLPEPLGPLQTDQQTQPWPALIPFSEKLSLIPDQSDTFCLVVKDNSPFCYAFNAQSYLYPNFQNPLWQLPAGSYYIKIELCAENVHKEISFKLKNSGNTVYDIYLSR